MKDQPVPGEVMSVATSPNRIGQGVPRPPASGGSSKTEGHTKGQALPERSPAGLAKSAMTYFPALQYHRRLGLHFCVRDGNRCFPKPMVTDKSPGRVSAA